MALNNNEVGCKDIFKEFRSNLTSLNTFTRSLIDVQNNLLYLYDVSKNCILVTRCLPLLYDSPYKRHQVYRITGTVLGEVWRLTVDPGGDLVAVLTSTNLYVAYLQHVATSTILPPTVDNKTTCSVWNVVTSASVLQAKWHPGLPAHLILLCSDDSLQLIDTKRRCTTHILPLSPHHVVDFDLGPPQTKWNEFRKREVTKYPLVILRSDGDVIGVSITQSLPSHLQNFWYHTSNGGNSSDLSEEEGEDLVSSIVVLQSHIPVVVTSYCSGFAYHSLLLGDDNDLNLQTFEKVKLRVRVNLNEDPVEKIRSPIYLIKDIGTVDRYFAVHDEGVLSVMLPVITTNQRFLQGPTLDNFDLEDKMHEFRVAVDLSESMVEYLLCTHVPGLTSRQPVFGLGVLTENLKTAELLVLLSDANIVTFPMTSLYTSFLKYKNPFFDNKQIERQSSFQSDISELLLFNRHLKPPVFKARLVLPNSTKILQQKFFMKKLMCFEEYIKKHQLVVDLLETKPIYLYNEHIAQVNGITTLIVMKEELKINAERIAEKYEETNDKQAELKKRIEIIGLIVASVQSPEEQVKTKQLLAFEEKKHKLQAALERVQLTLGYMNKGHLKLDQLSLLQLEARKNSMMSLLTNMSKSILDLRKKVEGMKL